MFIYSTTIKTIDIMRKENCLAKILVGKFKGKTLTFAACGKELALPNVVFCLFGFFLERGSSQSTSNNLWVINVKDQNSGLFDTNVD